MRIAVIHYHMRPGGVTRVIEATWASSGGRAFDMAVLAGQIPDKEMDRLPPSAVIDKLGYDQSADPVKLAAEIRRTAISLLGGPPDIWHVHNHSLGKNQSIPALVFQLASEGERLLLHIHDFAEDGRPKNYRRMLETIEENSEELSRRLYPVASHVHYAVLNHRDHRFLLHAGIPKSNLHLVPNPVLGLPEGGQPLPFGGKELFLYPTRAIRRKNIGEFLLWSAMAEPNQLYATTLAPTSSYDLPHYERWKSVARELNLPVAFELGAAGDFANLLASCRCVVTTSIAEGFGLAFVEPWLAGKPLCGRDLPNITSSVKEDGLMLDGLYQRVDIPKELVDHDALRKTLLRAVPQTYADYGRIPDKDAVEMVFESFIKNDAIDFGRLGETMQEDILRDYAAMPPGDRTLQPVTLDTVETSRENIVHNAETARACYGYETSRERMVSLYEAILGSERSDRLDTIEPGLILDQFLKPESFNLLRT